MKLTDLKEGKRLSFGITGNDSVGYDVESASGHHDHYDTKEQAQAAADKLNKKYNREDVPGFEGTNTQLDRLSIIKDKK